MFVSEHACRPWAAEGLTSTPRGSVTVVALTVASASPFAVSVGCWGTCTLTLSPVGVLPACDSGCALIDGVNGSRLQPPRVDDSNCACFQRGSPVLMLPSARRPPGSAQASANRVELSGPLHEPGIVRNGAGWACSVAHEALVTPNRHSQPRDPSWRESPGTPHRVTRLDSSEAICDTPFTLVITA